MGSAMDFISHKLAGGFDSYKSFDQLDFRIITTCIKELPFFEDDVFLGMQAINIGIVDQVITQHEYALLHEYNEIDKTPDSTMAVSALSQMWIYALYEVLRMWRDRKFKFEKLWKNGGIELKIKDMENDPLNHTLNARKQQMLRFKNDVSYRKRIDAAWEGIEGIFRATELIRMNLAKHCAPGNDNIIPMSPGYGRINDWCGSIDFQLIEKNKDYPQLKCDRYYTYLNRRDIADALRHFFIKKEYA
jgi:hypothetical protein